MIIDTVTPPIQSEERPDITIDCTNTIPTGGSVDDCTVFAKLASDGTDVTATIVDGACTVASPYVTQFIHDMTSGVDVILTFHVTYSNGRELDEEVYVPGFDF
jgi:hypothetical protein